MKTECKKLTDKLANKEITVRQYNEELKKLIAKDSARYSIARGKLKGKRRTA